MSEERIKERCKREDIAIKIVKGFLEKDCYSDTELFYSLETILNLIEKQQKEIEQLVNGIRVLGTNPDITTEEIIKEFTEKPISEEYMKEFKSRYISKDKIRDKILELEEIKNAFQNDEWKREYNYKIEPLKELLEEK